MFWTRRRRVAVVLAAMAATGVAGAGHFAFTNSTTLPATKAGYGTTQVSGGTVNEIIYAFNGTGDVITGVTLKVDGDMRGKSVQVAFNNDPLSGCAIGDFLHGSTTVTCGPFGQATDPAVQFRVLILDHVGATGGGSSGGGGGGGTTLALCDNFDSGQDGDSMNGRAVTECSTGNVVAHWEEMRGYWSTTGGRAKGTTANYPAWITMPYGATDATARVRVSSLDSFCGSGLALNANGFDSTIAVTLKYGTNNLQVHRYESGVDNVLHEWTVSLQGNDVLEVTRKAGELVIFLNGNPVTATPYVLPGDAGTVFSSDDFGLYACTQYTRFDDFGINPAP